MKGQTEVIKHLNIILKNELTAINQYFLHSRILKDWGILELAEKVHEESIGEMKHADMLVERILFLEGLPNLQDLHMLQIGEAIEEIFKSDLAVESRNQSDLLAAVACAEDKADYASRDLLSTILRETEEHIDWLETQQNRLALMGRENYLAQQMGGNGEGH